ncbi:MAG TPA: DUF1206 domain-containing protein [Flavisolibacter sp.]|nr:DUF1206 domain-containing protein [Flavisolibacter sp.]
MRKKLKSISETGITGHYDEYCFCITTDMIHTDKRNAFKKLAQVGLITKGIVYVLLGVFAFLTAFRLGNNQVESGNKQSVFRWIGDQTAGSLLIGALIIGLTCYALWRIIQGFANTEHKDKDAKGWAYRLRYIFSGLVYLSLAFSAFRFLTKLASNNDGQNTNEQVAGSLLQQPLGQILLGLLALGMAAAGIYQIWFGFSEKYKKYVQDISGASGGKGLLLNSGKIGYIARGLVWLTIGWLFLKAAINARAQEAASTSEAFQFLEAAPYGSYLMGGVGAGLACYGIFSFIRARYEHL